MDYPNFIVSNQKKESICIQRVDQAKAVATGVATASSEVVTAFLWWVLRLLLFPFIQLISLNSHTTVTSP